jgi:hypothetical protein
MWRHFDEPELRLPAPESRRTQSPPRSRARATQPAAAGGRRAVLRHAPRRPTSAPRGREVLLISRAAAVRSALLEVAALVRCSADLDPECIADLHTADQRLRQLPLQPQRARRTARDDA